MGSALMTMTVQSFANLHGKQTDAVQVKLRRMFPGQKFALDTELSADHLAALSVDRRTNVKRANVAEPKKQPQPKPQPTPEPEWVEIVVDKPAPEPEPEEETWTQEQERPFYRKVDFAEVRIWSFYVLLVLVVIGHAGLIWFDCSVLWGAPGVIGGGMSFLIAMAAVLLSFDSTRPRTSSTAIWVVFFVDTAAWFVHFPTFKASAAHVGDLHTGFISGFICLFSFAALYMLRDSNLD